MKKGLVFMAMLVSVLALGFSQSWTVNNVGTWIEAVNGIRTGGNDKQYTITVTGTVSVPAGAENEFTFGAVTGITVSMEGSGTLSISNNGRLLNIGNGQTVIAKDLTLKGRDANNAPVVSIGEGGVFRMEGNASVTGNTSSFYTGSGVLVGGTFNMSGGMITGNTGRYGVDVGGGRGIFTMSGGKISGNKGGGVSVGGGTFTMNGGEISGNTASGGGTTYAGGGVFVGGTFTMNGGEISGNTASFTSLGGGVYVMREGGTFTMSGGKISGNTASGSTPAGGGVFVGGTFTMSGGEISGNTASGGTTYAGGGVFVERGSFTMQDGAISGNRATASGSGSAGGGVHGIFTMNGGKIYGNTSSHSGGGVYAGSFTMQGGEISGNTAAVSGGGVYAYTFTMQGGEITGNTAGASGGGVYVWGDTFTKTGGTVYGDDAEPGLKNTVTGSRLGHALLDKRNNRWRNVGASPTMGTDSYGFWLNDGDPAMFPEGFQSRWGWKRSNFDNILTITENTVTASNNNYFWVLQRVSGNTYTLKRTDAATTFTLTIRLDGRNLVITGDSGNGQDNWNGTWSPYN